MLAAARGDRKNDLIRRYTVLLDREALGLKECLLAHVTLQRHAGQTAEEFERAVLAQPEVIECYSTTTGDADYILKVVGPDMKAYDGFLQKRIFAFPGMPACALRWCCARSSTTPCRRWIESRPPPQLSRQPISAAVPGPTMVAASEQGISASVVLIAMRPAMISARRWGSTGA